MTHRLSLLLAATCLACVAAVALSPATAEAKGGPFGLGIIGGNPTGITGKYFFGRPNSSDALDFHLGIGGWGRGDRADIGLYVDYLFHFDLGAGGSVMSMAIYVGPGGELLFDDHDGGRHCNKWGDCYDYRDGDSDIWIAARCPIGLSMLFQKVPLELFLEIVPELFIIQDIFFDIDFALGLRFYF